MKRNPAQQEVLSVIHSGDALPQWMRDTIGQSAQLRLPLRDPIDLRRQAAILRELANRFDVMSRDKRSAQSIMFEAYGEIRTAQDRLKSYPRSPKIWGLPKDGLSE
jgi:hypothetical protein